MSMSPMRFHFVLALILFPSVNFIASQAGLIITANTPGANGMGATNAGIPATFGDNISLPEPGDPVFLTYSGATGVVGTPNIGLTWSSVGGSNANRWEFHSWGGAGVANTGGGVLQMDGTITNSVFSITFTPSANAGVRLNSFNFVGDTNNGSTYQYRVDVVNLSSPGLVFTQTTAPWITSTSLTPSNSSSYAGAPEVIIGYNGELGSSYRLDITRIAGSGGAVDMAIDNLNFDQIPEPSSALLFLLGITLVRLFPHRS